MGLWVTLDEREDRGRITCALRIFRVFLSHPQVNPARSNTLIPYSPPPCQPLSLCTPSERASIEAKESHLKTFFSAMEANVLKNINAGDPSGSLIDMEQRERRDSDLKKESLDKFNEDGEIVESGFNRTSDDLPPPTRVVRTISSMDDLTLTELSRQKSSSSAALQGAGGTLLHPSLDDSARPNDIRR